MKSESRNQITQEHVLYPHIEQEAEQAVREIEFQKNQAEHTAEELERRELEALLLSAQKEEAEREAQEHEQAIERIAGE